MQVSEYTTWSSQFYVALVQEALATLGHSRDLVQIVVGYADVGAPPRRALPRERHRH